MQENGPVRRPTGENNNHDLKHIDSMQENLTHVPITETDCSIHRAAEGEQVDLLPVLPGEVLHGAGEEGLMKPNPAGAGWVVFGRGSCRMVWG